MKKIFLFSVFALSTVIIVSAQDLTKEDDPIFGKAVAEPAHSPFEQGRVRSTTKDQGPQADETGIVSNPIDGGLAILLASGALYGARRYKSSRLKAS